MNLLMAGQPAKMLLVRVRNMVLRPRRWLLARNIRAVRSLLGHSFTGCWQEARRVFQAEEVTRRCAGMDKMNRSDLRAEAKARRRLESPVMLSQGEAQCLGLIRALHCAHARRRRRGYRLSPPADWLGWGRLLEHQ